MRYRFAPAAFKGTITTCMAIFTFSQTRLATFPFDFLLIHQAAELQIPSVHMRGYIQKATICRRDLESSCLQIGTMLRLLRGNPVQAGTMPSYFHASVEDESPEELFLTSFAPQALPELSTTPGAGSKEANSRWSSTSPLPFNALNIIVGRFVCRRDTWQCQVKTTYFTL